MATAQTPMLSVTHTQLEDLITFYINVIRTLAESMRVLSGMQARLLEIHTY